MERIYIDSSVYIKLFKRERGTNTAKLLFEIVDSSTNTRLFLSYWTINESVAVIDQKHNQRNKKNKKRLISTQRRRVIISTILQKLVDYSYSGSKIIVVKINHNLVKDSMERIHTYSISADDALHLHIAYKNNCKWLISPDGRLKQQTDNKEGLNNMRILNVENTQEMDELFRRIT